MKSLILALMALLMSLSLFSQAPSIQWQKCYGGSDDDRAYSVQQTSDDGYIIAGWSYSNDGDVTGNHGYKDIWVVKVNSIGNIQWQKSFGGSMLDYGYSIQQTSDGGYIVAGGTESFDGEVIGNNGQSDFWIIKLSPEGNIQWQKCLGGSSQEIATSINQTSDDGYIVAGWSRSNNKMVSGNHGDYDVWVVKLDSSGLIEWQKSLGGSNIDQASSIQQTKEGGYIIAGYSESIDGNVTGNHGYDYWIVKLSIEGELQWQKSLGGNRLDEANSIQQTSDGGYIVAGESGSLDGDVTDNHGASIDYWIVKLSPVGVLEWQKSLGGSDYDYAKSIKQTKDGNYIIAGYSKSIDGDISKNLGDYDYWIVKINSSGTILWQKNYGGLGIDMAYDIKVTKDEGYIIAGWSASRNKDISFNHGSNDYWIVKLSPEGTDVEDTHSEYQLSAIADQSNNNLRISYTIPCESRLCIKLYSSTGLELRTLKNESSPAGTFNISASADDLPSGVYFCTMQSGTALTSSKFTIIK